MNNIKQIKNNSFFIWGLGLLGTSLAKEIINRGGTVYGCTKSENDIRYLHEIGLSNIVLYNDNIRISKYLKCVSAVIIATPVDSIFTILDYLDNNIETPLEFITDMASTKYDLMTWVDTNIQNLPFVGSHPMAGSGLSGPQNAINSLFEDVSIYITSSEVLSQKMGASYTNAQNRLQQFWKDLGGKPVLLNPSVHDQWGAYLSHGVHLVSCLLIHILKDIPSIFKLESPASGGSLRDMTRIVDSDPALWDAILNSNKKEIITYLDRTRELLLEWRNSFEKGELNVSAIFEEAAVLRSQLTKNTPNS